MGRIFYLESGVNKILALGRPVGMMTVHGVNGVLQCFSDSKKYGLFDDIESDLRDFDLKGNLSNDNVKLL